MRDAVTAALDVAGLLALAAGSFYAARPHVGLVAFGVAGVVILAGSAFFQWQAHR
ncbi:hypothetical protein [Micromonospora aurantiaca]|uniref:hypothetical protein n=1 Tax=Micromonospora aurantiaca (nom. illeg.) TaxID=47850 RepID=UPI0013C33818|nr:hypothetical protein [Micromonospora aurantiaca]